MGNMDHYNKLKSAPADALKPIGFGKLQGKSDINPQWRYEAMTSEFGACGVGWKYDIVRTWTHDAPDGQIMVFVEVAVSVKDGDAWSAPIPGIGGDFLVEKDKNGIHGNDEAYKMATTDALGVALKMLGVAADVYRGISGNNGTKYDRNNDANQPSPSNHSAGQQKPAQQATSAPKGDCVCAGCGAEITEKVANYSSGKFGRKLCMNCQNKAKSA